MTMHRVEEGQRLSEIAANYGISTDEIVRANPTKQAVMLASGAQVFASLADGEDIELPGVLGAGEVPNPPRVFLEAALQEVTEANQGNVTFATKRTKLDNARRKVASARLYVESRKLGADHIARIDEILADIEWLQDLAIAETNGPNPENPKSIDNWYPRIDRVKKRLSTEIGKYFQFTTTPTVPATGSFPTSSNPAWSGPLLVKLPFDATVEPTTGTVTKQKGEDECAAKNLRFNRATEQCVSVDGTSTDPFTGAVTGTLTKLKVEEDCVASGGVYDFASSSCRCPNGSEWNQGEGKCGPIVYQQASPGGEACPDGTWWKRETNSCVPNDSQADPFPRMGENDGKILGEARRRMYEEELAKNRAAEAASSSKTKKVLIVAGSVLALGLAGFGAWHMFAKDKATEKPAP